MTGTIKQIIGPVVDVEFTDNLPAIFHALEVESPTGEPRARLVLEVQQHLSGRLVRAVAMSSTDGLQRGAKVTDTGGPITVLVRQKQKNACLYTDLLRASQISQPKLKFWKLV